ncbi:c-type cytochrome [Pseudomonas guariconensis]|uniref:c-type cytochrome n=1 Tax=Pseudomonas guariconensis TaxID=1288410 RepID=UPI00209AEFDD|nr:c-type cytochrome [Pseudomonas guariconensis]MCO7623077.1 c-type cytochrome [Pseudomonas guariconensis]
MKRTMTTLVVAGAVASAAALGAAYSGLVNVGADDPHFPAVHAFLVMARERSIEVRARDIEVPNLKDEALIRTGAGNYNAMCVGCHLAPGVDQTELSQALYPPPPNLAKIGTGDNPAVAFWTIKHGIKATGMPAWGKSMGDQYIWGIVAFLDRLPQMDAQQYQAMVASSGGHQHSGGESAMHSAGGHHGQGTEQSKAHHPPSDSAHSSGHHDGHGGAETDVAQPATPSPTTHVHRDGKEHTHGN